MIARLSLRTGISPPGLMEEPEVTERMIELTREEDRDQVHEGLRRRLEETS